MSDTPIFHSRSLRLLGLAAVLAGGVGLTACGSLSEQGKSTAIGAGVGAVAGQVITGSPAGAIGGAVLGGVIGNEEGKK